MEQKFRVNFKNGQSLVINLDTKDGSEEEIVEKMGYILRNFENVKSVAILEDQP